MEVSSTEIRRRLEDGHKVVDLLPDSVLAYILSNGLYGTGCLEQPGPRPG
jgi:nicotinic acid mononucleotide adenylyltransferase